jgi:hypothetical protein
MDNNLVISIIAMVGSFFGVICGIINHKRLRSKCLSEKELILSLDVEDTTPQKKEDDRSKASIANIKQSLMEDLKITLPKIKEEKKEEEENSVKVKDDKT